MNDEQGSFRPIGWWLKEADARLDAVFDSALEGTGVDRRGWQVLAALSRAPTRRAELAAALAAFDPPATVDGVIDALRSRGWVDESPDALTLTQAGAEQHQAFAPRVEGVRRRVAAALPHEDYATLIGLLARMITALRPTP